MNWKKTANLFLSMILAFSTMMSDVTVFAEGEEGTEEFVTEEVTETEETAELITEEVTETEETEDPVIEEVTVAEETAEPEAAEPVTEENDETELIPSEEEEPEEEIVEVTETEEPEQEEPSEQETAEPVPEEGEEPSEEILTEEEETADLFAVSGDYQYSVSNNTVTITKYIGTDEEVVIPSVIDGKNVTAIGDYAFAEDENITIVTVPNGVKSIGNYAFSSTDYLEKINLPDSLTSIGEGAFKSCTSLVSITIPDSVTTLGKELFYFNPSLEEVKLPANLTAIPSRIFYHCYSLKNIDIPKSVKSIGEYAFADNESLEEIVIPNGVTTLDSRLFDKCTNLSKVTIPASVTKLANGGVFGESTNLKTAGPIGSGSDIEFGWTETIPENAFIYTTTLTDVEIPYGVKTIGTSAFDYCDNLTAITIPETVKVIKPAAFQHCSSLKDVYYYGTAEDWNKITINQGNDQLKKVTFHYKGIQLRALKINAEDGEIVLHSGESRKLEVTRTPANSGDDLYWETSDGNTLTVDQNGTVTAVKSGSAVIKVRNEDGSVSDTVEIIVAVEVTGITLNKTEGTLAKGGEEQLTATVKPDNATFKDVKWRSSNQGVVRVDQTGHVTAVGGGTAVVTAEADGGITATCTYSVLVSVTGISADESINVPLEKDTEISYQIEPSDATNQKVTFTTGNAEIAKVSADGVITGLKLGETDITIKTEDGGYQAVVHVTVVPDGIYMDLIEESYAYTGSAIKPAVRLYDQGTLLKEKTDYTVTYANNTKAGTAKITIKMAKDYKGTITKTFEITPVDLNDPSVTCDALTLAETGKTLSPVPAVYFNGKKLKAKTDYIVDYTGWDRLTGDENNEAVVTIIAKENGNFSGERKVTVYIAPKGTTVPVSKLKVTAAALKYEDLTEENFAEKVKEAITVKDGKTGLQEGINYTVKDIKPENRAVGSFKVTLEGNDSKY
ncbi:MAG: leucine-rich repeat protein, partial [Erysipelotrichaceae bacterium]|nr:leucine-rich repeat protein [Erysipelotrichaceae bacterium]